jgi:hypothetical protein
MGVDAGMAIAGSAAPPKYGEPATGNTGPKSMDGECDFPPGKEFRVQEGERDDDFKQPNAISMRG